jgi:hypothetical protein
MNSLNPVQPQLVQDNNGVAYFRKEWKKSEGNLAAL